MYNRQKTKIVATLGDPKLRKLNEETGEIEESSTYEKGLYNIKQEPIHNPSLQDIVNLLFKHGVDVIRINLAHILLDDLPHKFREIKGAILAAEKQYKCKIGVLADLPGPKIRFNKSNWLIPLKTLRVSFDEIKEKENVTPRFKDREKREENEVPEESLAQINLGKIAFSAASNESSLAVNKMLKAVEERLAAIKEHRQEQKLLAFIGDNDCTLEVLGVSADRVITCKVVSVKNGNRVVGGSKGFTIRGIPKPISAFTPQDEAKLSALLDVDYERMSKGGKSDRRILSHIGISFCQTRDDVRRVQYHVIEKCIKPKLRLHGGKLGDYLVETPLLIAKIETAEGITNREEVLDIADGAMIARGDLAVEIETADVPRRSKEIINHCNLRGKPVIMATQMLESMKDTIECTRPEATDVFNAVLDNVDALMLSGETSSGKYPAHAIEKMRALSKNAEDYIEGWPSGGHEEKNFDKEKVFFGDVQIQKHFRQLEQIKERVDVWQDRWEGILNHYTKKYLAHEITREEKIFVDDLAELKNDRLKKQHSTDRITHAACTMSVDPAVKYIVSPTTSGRTARMLSRFRPRVWILAQPHNQLTARKLTIDRGVMVINILPVMKDSKETDPLVKESKKKFKEAIRGDETVIFTCGTPLGQVGTANMIQRWDAELT
ncbi:MAG TPA: pyruvate kinase [Pyrinomonadaceae bacterium]